MDPVILTASFTSIIIFLISLYHSIVFFSWRLQLEAWSLRLEAFEKLLTAAQVTGRQCAMIISEPWQQVIVLNVSFSHTFPYPVLLVSGSLPAHQLFFLIVLCP